MLIISELKKLIDATHKSDYAKYEDVQRAIKFYELGICEERASQIDREEAMGDDL